MKFVTMLSNRTLTIFVRHNRKSHDVVIGQIFDMCKHSKLYSNYEIIKPIIENMLVNKLIMMDFIGVDNNKYRILFNGGEQFCLVDVKEDIKNFEVLHIGCPDPTAIPTIYRRSQIAAPLLCYIRSDITDINVNAIINWVNDNICTILRKACTKNTHHFIRDLDYVYDGIHYTIKCEISYIKKDVRLLNNFVANLYIKPKDKSKLPKSLSVCHRCGYDKLDILDIKSGYKCCHRCGQVSKINK